MSRSYSNSKTSILFSFIKIEAFPWGWWPHPHVPVRGKGLSSADTLNSTTSEQCFDPSSLPPAKCFPQSLCKRMPSSPAEHQYESPNEGIFISFIKLSIKDTSPVENVAPIRNPPYKRIHLKFFSEFRAQKKKITFPWNMMCLPFYLSYFLFSLAAQILSSYFLRNEVRNISKPINNSPAVLWLTSPVPPASPSPRPQILSSWPCSLFNNVASLASVQGEAHSP